MMTERSYTIPLPIATSHQSAIQPSLNLIARDDTQDAEGEEEPFTIKCICGYDDDDGNTVLCEKCDTWQHIICFYPNDLKAASRDDFLHKCHECEPRESKLDALAARRIQFTQRADAQRKIDSELDRKATKKSHKKKPPSDLIVNGTDQDRGNVQKKGSPADRPATHRKPKPHRSRPSISSHPSKRSPSYNQAHPPSPITSPADIPHLYKPSDQLRAAYENDPGHKQMRVNTFASMEVISRMSKWLMDPDHLRRTVDTDIKGILNHFSNGFDFFSYNWPSIKIRTEEVGTKESSVRVKYLESVAAHHTQIMLCELNGSVGFQEEMCIDMERDFYSRLSHPPPFVFFHPALPLYIDTRQEGSLCRYTRRSCNPNCVIDTYIMNQGEYHFVLVNEDPIPAGAQLTLAWDFKFPNEVRERYKNLLVSSHTDPSTVTATDITREEYESLSRFIAELLSEFGGCACGLGNDCSFVRFHRSHREKFRPNTNGVRVKKGRKPKNQASPTSGLPAQDSREQSEVNNHEDDDQDDSRSTSGSVRSKQPSREMTPALDPILDSERERRKIEAIERQFTNQEPPKKKKRPSEGAAIGGASQPQLKRQKTALKSQPLNAQTPNGIKHKDLAPQRPLKGPVAKTTSIPSVASPHSHLLSRASSPHTEQSRRTSTARRTYIDAGMQTDASMDTNSWYSPSQRPIPKKRVISIECRLYNAHVKRELAREEKRKQEANARSVMPTAMDARIAQIEGRSSGPNYGLRPPSYLTSLNNLLPKYDDPPVAFPVSGDNSTQLPQDIAPNMSSASQASGRHGLSLHLPMPIPPAFLSMSSTVSMTPTTADNAKVQTPFGNSTSLQSAMRLNTPSVTMSPVKKLTLSDYKRLKKPTGSASLHTESSNITDTTTAIEEKTNSADAPVSDNGAPKSPLLEAGTVVTSLERDPGMDTAVTTHTRTPLPSL